MSDETIKVEGTAEVQEKRVTAGVDGGRIDHDTQAPGEPQEVEERKRKLVEAYMAGRAAPPATSPASAAKDKANQGSVVAIVAAAVVGVLLLIGFAVLMWRISKGESQMREFVLEKV